VKQYRTNVVGAVAVTNAFLPLVEKGAQKKVINISSAAGDSESVKGNVPDELLPVRASEVVRDFARHSGMANHGSDVVCSRLRPTLKFSEHNFPVRHVFDDARRALTWHYQWLIVNEFLPVLVGTSLVEELAERGPAHYRPVDEPFIPVEFADAAYRYGHSQIRQLYRLQPDGPARPVFPDLMGFGPVGDRRVDWSLLFDVPGHPAAQRAKPIDGTLPRSLIELPAAITGAVDESAYRSLAGRDLERGLGTGLPSGESVAQLLGADALSDDELGLREHGWRAETPLWLYVLREAWVRQQGDRLGEVGGRIVAEVLYGVIGLDPESYLAVEPDWTPTLPARDSLFGLSDLLVPAEAA